MMLKKSIVRMIYAFSFTAACLTGAVAPANAWDEIIIDYETHLDKNVVQGTYTDWTGLRYPWASGNQWPFVYNNYARNTSAWASTGNPQPRFGVAVWRVQIPKTGWYDLRASYKETHNRTTAAQYYVYTDVTLDDIHKNDKEKLAKHQKFYMSFDQNGDDAGQFNYAEFPEFCLHKGEVAVLVLDARATVRSSSADAAIWKYLGKTHNAQECVDAPPAPKAKIVPHIVTPLLFDKQ